MELYQQFKVVVKPDERRACDRSKYPKMYGHKIFEQTFADSDAIQNGKWWTFRLQSRNFVNERITFKNIKEACYNNTELRNCSCTVSYVRLTNDGTSFTPMYSINCSRLNLYRLPSFVPENTTIFHATDNKVPEYASVLYGIFFLLGCLVL